MLQLKLERVNTSFFVESSLKGRYWERKREREREIDREIDECGRSSVIGSVCNIASWSDSAYIVYTHIMRISCGGTAKTTAFRRGTAPKNTITEQPSLSDSLLWERNVNLCSLEEKSYVHVRPTATLTVKLFRVLSEHFATVIVICGRRRRRRRGLASASVVSFFGKYRILVQFPSRENRW